MTIIINANWQVQNNWFRIYKAWHNIETHVNKKKRGAIISTCKHIFLGFVLARMVILDNNKHDKSQKYKHVQKYSSKTYSKVQYNNQKWLAKNSWNIIISVKCCGSKYQKEGKQYTKR